jgi:hypothetical protein
MNTFIRNRAYITGGAIHIDTVVDLDIAKNTFKENVAQPRTKIERSGRHGEAGVILYGCPPDTKVFCKVSLRSNLFEDNIASSKGGAVLWVNRNFTSTKAVSEDEFSLDDDFNEIVSNSTISEQREKSYYKDFDKAISDTMLAESKNKAF